MGGKSKYGEWGKSDLYSLCRAYGVGTFGREVPRWRRWLWNKLTVQGITCNPSLCALSTTSFVTNGLYSGLLTVPPPVPWTGLNTVALMLFAALTQSPPKSFWRSIPPNHGYPLMPRSSGVIVVSSRRATVRVDGNFFLIPMSVRQSKD